MAVFLDSEKLRLALEAGGGRVVFTNGCFDLLHAGHVHLLQQAKELGDVLVVAINSDESIRDLKGPDKPFVPQEDRAFMIDALAAVDHVIIFVQPTPMELLDFLRPDVLVKGDQYSFDEVVGADFVVGYGGEVKTVSIRPNLSSTSIADRIRRSGTATVPNDREE